MKDVNDDDLVLSSSGVVLEVNERGKLFYKTLRDIVERTCIDILSTYNTKINPMTPRIRLYINYRKHF
jgi:hypothetical protein